MDNRQIGVLNEENNISSSIKLNNEIKETSIKLNMDIKEENIYSSEVFYEQNNDFIGWTDGFCGFS